MSDASFDFDVIVIGAGYGGFDAAIFAQNAADPQIRMIEIKLSQGAKPGHGGVLDRIDSATATLPVALLLMQAMGTT